MSSSGESLISPDGDECALGGARNSHRSLVNKVTNRCLSGTMLTVVSPPSPLCHCACAVLIVEIHLLTPRVVSYMHVVQDKEKINTSVVSGFICGG